MVTTVQQWELCPFCGSVDVDTQGASDFVRCNKCKAFGPNGEANWERRAPSRRVLTLIARWRDTCGEMQTGGCVYTAPYDAVGDLLDELEEAVRVQP
jgi:hypothetical protein